MIFPLRLHSQPRREITMADSVLNFEEGDFDSLLPAEGYYEAVIERARFHRSQQGNTTLQVTCQIMGVSPGNDIVADYFVLSGSSERGRAVSRRRLLELYRACGFSPKKGDPIKPMDLVGSQLQVRLGHETYDGVTRLRVLGYRALP
jgi:hypothetical protein